MRVRYDFAVDAWIKNVEIDGNNKEDCKEQLLNMSLSDLISDGYVKDFIIKDIDEVVTEDTKEILVEVSDIVYDIDDEDLEDTHEMVNKEDILKTLPKTLILDLDVEMDDDVKEAISDAISDETGWLVDTFNYRILKK